VMAGSTISRPESPLKSNVTRGFATRNCF